MTNFEATFTDISTWHKNIHYSTGGTRSKYIALNPENNEEYFFKGSKETILGEIRYPTEFWSEIISSKIGIEKNSPESKVYFLFPTLICPEKEYPYNVEYFGTSVVFSSP